MPQNGFPGDLRRAPRCDHLRGAGLQNESPVPDIQIEFTGQAAQAKVVALGDENTPVAVTFELEAGTWAFSVIHDEDHDGQLDTNFIGMPTEGVGASTKPGTSRLGPPRFTDATATIGTAGKTLRIELAYLL